MLYEIHCGSADLIGVSLIQNVIHIANQGGVMKEGTLPFFRFPFIVVMTLESETPPIPTPSIRVFEADSRKEVFATLIEAASTFSFDFDESVLATNDDGKPWTKEQLDSMDFETEFRKVCKAVGVTGRSRDKMTKEYFAAVSKIESEAKTVEDETKETATEETFKED